MKIDILTIFPGFYQQFLETSIIHRAIRDGKVVINTTFENGNVDLDVNDLPKGQYVLMIKSKNEVRSWKLVK